MLTAEQLVEQGYSKQHSENAYFRWLDSLETDYEAETVFQTAVTNIWQVNIGGQSYKVALPR